MSFLWQSVRPFIYAIGCLNTYVLRRGSLTPRLKFNHYTVILNNP